MFCLFYACEIEFKTQLSVVVYGTCIPYSQEQWHNDVPQNYGLTYFIMRRYFGNYAHFLFHVIPTDKYNAALLQCHRTEVILEHHSFSELLTINVCQTCMLRTVFWEKAMFVS